MKKSIIKILTIILISIPIVLLLFYIDSNQKNNDNIIDKNLYNNNENTDVIYNPLNPESNEERNTYEDCINCDEVAQTEIEIQELKQAAWIPPWDYNRGVSSLNSFETSFHSSSPVTFSINSNGTLTNRVDPNLLQLKEIKDEKSILIIPTISNFDWKLMKGIFDSQANTQRHINSIVEAVTKYDYDGIDLDYESLSLQNKEHFLEFIKKLSEELNKENKILSVTVLPKWGDDVKYKGLAETRQVQDWEDIGKHADQVRIMTYDYTTPNDSVPGPIAPISWMEDVLEYAIAKIPRQKIWLGIHLYSYEWVLATKEPNAAPIKTNSYTYDVLKNKLPKEENVHIHYNEELQEGYADYNCQNNNFCIIYYATPESVRARQNLANKYNIAGVVYWRLGGEDDLLR